MLIAGWADGYRNNTFRTVRALSRHGTPVHLLAGPWSHMSPATSVPGPVYRPCAVDGALVGSLAAWASPTAWTREPSCTIFVRRYAEPQPDAVTWPGRWQAHDVGSLEAVRDLDLPLAEALGRSAPVRSRATPPVLDVGVTAWNSCAAAQPWGQPQDQAPDEATLALPRLGPAARARWCSDTPGCGCGYARTIW